MEPINTSTTLTTEHASPRPRGSVFQIRTGRLALAVLVFFTTVGVLSATAAPRRAHSVVRPKPRKGPLDEEAVPIGLTVDPEEPLVEQEDPPPLGEQALHYPAEMEGKKYLFVTVIIQKPKSVGKWVRIAIQGSGADLVVGTRDPIYFPAGTQTRTRKYFVKMNDKNEEREIKITVRGEESGKKKARTRIVTVAKP